MTVEERFERLEHVVAGLAEERRKDREEYRQRWRENQEQINSLGSKIDRFVDESREAHARFEDRMDRLDKESRERDKVLDERVDKLVSAIGELISRMPS